MNTPTFTCGNLVWNQSGECWALFRLATVPFTYLSAEQKLSVHGRLVAALNALPGEAVMMSACREINPDAVGEMMINGTEQTTRWIERVRDNVETLYQHPIYERYLFLAVKVEDQSGLPGFLAGWSSMESSLRDVMGMVRGRPSDDEISLRQTQAADIQVRLSTISCEPARAEEIRWLLVRSVLRGLYEVPLDEVWSPHRETFETDLGDVSKVQRIEAEFLEGGSKDDPERRDHRYLKVQTEAGVSYQTFMPIAAMPRHMRYPDGNAEWLALADLMPWPVDWYMTIKPVGNQDARRKVRHQQRQVIGTTDEYEGDELGAPEDVMMAGHDLEHLAVALSTDGSAPMLRFSTVFCLAASSLSALDRMAEELRMVYAADQYHLPRVTGGQLHMFESGLPGNTPHKSLSHYEQTMVPTGVAASMPLAGSRVGDASGTLLGRSKVGGRQPVLFDIGLSPQLNQPTSVTFNGEPGSGKSMTMKRVLDDAVASGHQVVVLDKTSKGEYADVATVIEGSSQVVNLGPSPNARLDPLLSITSHDPALQQDLRIKAGRGFLTLACNIRTQSNEGTTLAKAVEVAVTAGASICDVPDIVEEMLGPEAELVRRLRLISEGSEGRAVFDRDLPIADLSADFIVLWTPNLSLPTKAQLETPALADQLTLENFWAQGLVFLVSAIAQATIFASLNRFGLAVYDEAWTIMSSPQGLDVVMLTARDGRKHNAGMILSSQNPDDFPEEILDLCPVQLSFRQSNGSAAAKALLNMGIDPSPGTVKQIQNLDAGECFMMDRNGRVGRVAVHAPTDPEVYAAFDTNPGGQPVTSNTEYGSGRDWADLSASAAG